MPIPIIASIPLLAVYHAAGGLTTVVVPLVVRDYLGSLFDLGKSRGWMCSVADISQDFSITSTCHS